MANKDVLFLLKPGFEDAKYPGKSFICPACTFLEGILAVHPGLADKLDVVRVDFPRPRAAVIALAGEANQGLPVLVSTDPAAAARASAQHEGRYLINDKQAIAEYLAERHGSGWPH